MFCYGYLDCLFDFIILFIYWKFFFFFPIHIMFIVTLIWVFTVGFFHKTSEMTHRLLQECNTGKKKKKQNKKQHLKSMARKWILGVFEIFIPIKEWWDKIKDRKRK